MRRRKEDAEATRNALLDAAETLFLRNGVSKTTLEAIAGQAKVTRGALYWHFRDKADLYAAMIERVQLPYEALYAGLADAQQDPLESVRSLSNEVIRRVTCDERVRRVCTIILHRQESAGEHGSISQVELEDRHRGYAFFERSFSLLDQEGRLCPGMSPARAAIMMQSFLIGLLYHWLMEPSRFSLSEEGPVMVDAVLQGIVRAHRPQEAGSSARTSARA